MNNSDLKRIVTVLSILIIILGVSQFRLQNKVSNLERKIIKITHELDYTKGVVKNLSE